MSANKKTTAKSAKSPAPATKPAAPKSAAKKKTAPAVVVAAAPAPAAVETPLPAAAPVAAPLAPVAPAASKPVVTTIAARVDVGFGNALYIRGQGANLSWDKGVKMNCVASDLWHVSLPEAAGYTFKFLINDHTWCKGPDYTAAAGVNVTLTPEF